MKVDPFSSANADVSGNYADINGLNMYYEWHGITGEFLVLIHGGGSTISTTFGNILPLLSGSFQVLAVELQAHGHTSDRENAESFEQDADDVAELLRKLNITGASVLGFSNGGTTALHLALRHPDLVSKLVLASAAYSREGLQPGFFEGMKQASLDHMPDVLKRAFLRINRDEQALLNMFNKDKERMLNFKNMDEEAIHTVNVPALIICGDRDVVRSEHAINLSRLLENSRVLIVPASHGDYIGVAESPAASDLVMEFTANMIRRFLR